MRREYIDFQISNSCLPIVTSNGVSNNENLTLVSLNEPPSVTPSSSFATLNLTTEACTYLLHSAAWPPTV